MASEEGSKAWRWRLRSATRRHAFHASGPAAGPIGNKANTLASHLRPRPRPGVAAEDQPSPLEDRSEASLFLARVTRPPAAPPKNDKP